MQSKNISKQFQNRQLYFSGYFLGAEIAFKKHSFKRLVRQ
jgi:hypothetical protein